MRVVRNPSSKWFVSYEEFRNDYYKKYCSGSAYLITPDLPPLLFNASLYTKFFWIDDYYITGLLREAVDADFQNYNSLYEVYPDLVEKKFTEKESEYTIFGHLSESLNKMYSIWEVILENQLRRFPSLYSLNASITGNSDFHYLRPFQWSQNVWNAYHV
jgi:hypothetical protein